MREIPPTMVLSEETGASVIFRFRSGRWAAATLVLGGLLLAVATRGWLHGSGPRALLAVLAGFGLLLLYSTVYSLTATQWLKADPATRTVTFYKDNLYGRVAWEKPACEFQAIRVFRQMKSSTWTILLVDQEGYELSLGENVFGAWSRKRALALADKVSSRTGIAVQLV
jgi:hypothetical protein